MSLVDSVTEQCLLLLTRPFYLFLKLQITTQKWSQEKSNNAEAQLLLGFAAPESSDEISDDVENVVTEERSVDGSTYSLKGLVVGPESNRFADAKRFRAVWAGGMYSVYLKICNSVRSITPFLNFLNINK